MECKLTCVICSTKLAQHPSPLPQPPTSVPSKLRVGRYRRCRGVSRQVEGVVALTCGLQRRRVLPVRRFHAGKPHDAALSTISGQFRVSFRVSLRSSLVNLAPDPRSAPRGMPRHQTALPPPPQQPQRPKGARPQATHPPTLLAQSETTGDACVGSRRAGMECRDARRSVGTAGPSQDCRRRSAQPHCAVADARNDMSESLSERRIPKAQLIGHGRSLHKSVAALGTRHSL